MIMVFQLRYGLETKMGILANGWKSIEGIGEKRLHI